MRFFLFLSVMMISRVCGAQVIQNHTIYNITPFVLSCSKELQLDSCLIFIDDTQKLYKFGLEGHSREMDKGISYVILVRKNLSFFQTQKIIAHELVHISQMKRGMLNFDSDSIRFGNTSYPNTVLNHSDDEHEIEARNRGGMLLDKYRNVLINYN